MMAKTPIFISNSFNEGPLYGNLGCQIFGIVGSFTGIGSAATNAAIAFDRFRHDTSLTRSKYINMRECAETFYIVYLRHHVICLDLTGFFFQ